MLYGTCFNIALFNSFEIILLPQPCQKGESSGYPLGSPWRWAAMSGKHGTCHDVVTLRLFLKLLQIQSHTIYVQNTSWSSIQYPTPISNNSGLKSGQPCCTDSSLPDSWELTKVKDFLSFPWAVCSCASPGNWIMSRPGGALPCKG